MNDKAQDPRRQKLEPHERLRCHLQLLQSQQVRQYEPEHQFPGKLPSQMVAGIQCLLSRGPQWFPKLLNLRLELFPAKHPRLLGTHQLQFAPQRNQLWH